MTENNVHLSVIIPAYNEEDRIEKTLRAVDAYLSRQPHQYEIIVVNDGSRDRTAQVVKGMEPFVKNLRLIDNALNQGKGTAVKQGMLGAKGELRLFMDADNSTSVDQVERIFLAFQEGAEVAIGSRRAPGAVVAVHQSFLRENSGVIFNFIIRLLTGLPYKDTQAGFKAFSSRAAKEIFSRQTIDGFTFDAELLVIARQLSFSVKEVPIAWANDPKTHVKIKSIIRMLFDVFKVRLNLALGKYAP
jgi:glycosyltransferase involved in cell wall biosynthesis